MLLRSIEVWLVISVVEIIHGIVRVALVEPLVGDLPARQLAVFSGSVLILGVAFVFRNWIGSRSPRECIIVGLIWVTLTLAFEIALGRIVLGVSWERILSDYDIFRGGLMPLGLLVMLLAPMLIRSLSLNKK